MYISSYIVFTSRAAQETGKQLQIQHHNTSSVMSPVATAPWHQLHCSATWDLPPAYPQVINVKML